MKKINAYCKICGNGYHMCFSCKDYARLHPWQADTDNAEHYKIFYILSGYNSGLYSKKDARERLLNVDLSDLETFLDDKKECIKNILDSENKPEDANSIEKPQTKQRRSKKQKQDNNISLNNSEK